MKAESLAMSFQKNMNEMKILPAAFPYKYKAKSGLICGGQN